jgi:cytochrome c biogenesis protein CcdA
MVFGAVVFWAGGGKDLGGIVGGVFFCAGFFLTLLALQYTGKKD